MGLETIIAIAGVAVSAAGTGAAIHQGQQQAKQAEKASDAQSNEAANQRAALAEKQRQEEASTAAASARSRQRLSSVAGGKKSNILTSPLGLPNDGLYKGTTLLGGGKL